MERRIVVVNLCGCPAVGKSTLARNLHRVLESVSSVFIVSYDQIERKNYKLCTQDVTWERQTWKQSRIRALKLISDLLDTLRQGFGESESEDIVKFACNGTQEEFSTVVVDDTMHLRSMRHSIMKLCQLCTSLVFL